MGCPLFLHGGSWGGKERRRSKTKIKIRIKRGKVG